MEVIVRRKNDEISTNNSENIPFPSDNSTFSPVEKTELKDALEELNSDELEEDGTKSKADQRANFSEFQFYSTWTFDALVIARVLPASCRDISRQFKRLSVSQGGESRKQIVNVSQSKRTDDIDAGKTLINRMNPFAK